ncbi:hypothetical protein OK016_05015 [Vibrio chagasii]|nr:hypothetical protein [Vibrio chagasii]
MALKFTTLLLQLGGGPAHEIATSGSIPMEQVRFFAKWSSSPLIFEPLLLKSFENEDANKVVLLQVHACWWHGCISSRSKHLVTGEVPGQKQAKRAN